MYAQIEVEGVRVDPIFTDPYTGRYRIALPADASYSLRVTPQYAGYQPTVAAVDLDGDGVRRDVTLAVDAERCTAAGYDWTYPGAFSDFEGGTKPEGWTVVDSTGNGGWVFDDPGSRGNQTGGSGGFAIFDGTYLPDFQPFDSELITPAADLSDVDAPVLDLDLDYVGTSNAVGEIDLSLDGGETWTNVWRARGGYQGQPLTVDLPQAANRTNVRVRFHYQTINYGWWQLDNVMLGERNCSPTPGGLIAGQVHDANTGDGLSHVRVESVDAPAEHTLTEATPADPGLDEGFFWMFSSQTGSRAFTASRSAYETATARADVDPDAVTRVDLSLDAGRLVAKPNQVEADLAMGSSTDRTVTLTNDGRAPVTVDLRERGGDFDLMSAYAGAPRQRIEGDFSPDRSAPTAGLEAPRRPHRTTRPGPASPTFPRRCATTASSRLRTAPCTRSVAGTGSDRSTTPTPTTRTAAPGPP